MKQRVPRRAWHSPGRPGRRPRVLIEDAHPALAVSDFSLFQDAGFDVAYCSGPERVPEECPLLGGGSCPVLAGADAVLHRLDPGLGIAVRIRRQYPDAVVVAEQRRRLDGTVGPAAEGCEPLAPHASVKGQIDALRRALARRRAVA